MLDRSDLGTQQEAGLNLDFRKQAPSAHSKHSATRKSIKHDNICSTGQKPTTTQRLSRALTLKTAAKEYVWLYDHRHGVSLKGIAARDRVSVQRVVFGVGRARAQEKSSTRNSLNELFSPKLLGPGLVPLFPVGQYTPQSTCPHKAPIERGSTLCCMICHQSGMDQHPALQRDLKTDPAPEARSAPQLTEKPKSTRQATRKERRSRAFGLNDE